MPFGGVLQSRVARRHLDAVQQNHDADVDPGQEHPDCGDRAVDDVPGRKVGGIPGKQRKGDAHTSMSTKALNSELVRDGMLEVLLRHTGLYEALREKAAG